MSCYFPTGPIPLYWLRVPRKVIRELREHGFHDGYSRDQKLDADVQLLKAFSPGISLAYRDLHLEDWLTWVDRESCLRAPGHPTLWHPALDREAVQYIRRRFAHRLVEIQARTTEVALHKFRLTKWQFGIFYHVACMGHWQEVVEEQLALLKRVGLNGVRAGMLGTGGDRAQLQAIAARHEIDLCIEYHHTDLQMFEIPTIEMLSEWCQYNDGYVLYFHTKGVSDRYSPFKEDWRQLMHQWVVERWRENAELLRAGYDAVGVNWQHNPPNSHFPGNFWMARTSFIRALKPFQQYDRELPYVANNRNDQERLAAEFWIGSYSQEPRIHSHVARNKVIDQAAFWERVTKSRTTQTSRRRNAEGLVRGQIANRAPASFRNGSDGVQQRYLALCLFVKDENEYLAEWLDYHLLLGVEHFFVYDNNSRRPIRTTVAKYVRRGLVTVYDWPETTAGRQCRAYAECLQNHGREFFWIGFIDTDEFIVPANGKKLPQFLRRYEPYGALGIFWLCFGSNGLLKKPKRGVLRSFIRRSHESFESNEHVKCIVNTRFAVPEPAADPHQFHFAPGYFAVDENENPILGPRRRPRTSQQIRLNHYIVRSRVEFVAKIRRGGGNSSADLKQYAGAYWDKHEAACNAIEDRTVLDIVRKFKTDPTRFPGESPRPSVIVGRSDHWQRTATSVPLLR
jgi:hypothetical protein